MGVPCLAADGNLATLTHLSRAVAEIANLAPDTHLPYVGKSAFAHKGGIHVAAMRRNVDSYQHIEPELVGNETRVLVSDLSGRGNLLSKAEELGLNVSTDEAVSVLNEVKELESAGFSFEGAEASVAVRLHRAAPAYEPLFKLLDFHRHRGRPARTGPTGGGDGQAGYRRRCRAYRGRGQRSGERA